MAKICVLTEDVANQIAAGEVVERPSSVVKELVENSLDAGATRIDIEILAGGLERIVVSDNGSGLAADDLSLAFLRHATSKLRHSEDLIGIKTLGFRGEALPSIASVSKVLVTTRQEAEPTGWRLAVPGSAQPDPCGAPGGTSIRVDELFYNTPARRQFMKSATAEAGRIRELVAHMALAAPQVAFRLLQDDRTVLETVGNNSLPDAILAIYGRDVVEQLIPVDGGSLPMRVRGLISRPELTRNNRRDQVFILNGRLVQCRSLSVVLAEAYRSLLPGNRHPLAFLHLELPPETVDVNVHPAKVEVRLREERQVAAILHRVLRQALEQAGHKTTRGPIAPAPSQEAVAEPRPASISYWSTESQPPNMGLVSRQDELPKVPISMQQVKQHLTGIDQTSQAQRPQIKQNEANYQTGGERTQAVGEETQAIASTTAAAYRLLGQIQSSYLGIERADGFWLIDQHAAHERVIYEQLSGQTGWQAVQQLLVPYSLQLGPRESGVLEESGQMLRDLGFDTEHFGGHTWLLRSLPDVYRGRFQADHFADLVSALADDWQSSKQLDRRERVLIRLSCKGAIKAGQRLHNAEMIELLDQLWQTKLPFTCPHGRPTGIRFSAEHLFRMFHP